MDLPIVGFREFTADNRQVAKTRQVPPSQLTLKIQISDYFVRVLTKAFTLSVIMLGVLGDLAVNRANLLATVSQIPEPLSAELLVLLK